MHVMSIKTDTYKKNIPDKTCSIHCHVTLEMKCTAWYHLYLGVINDWNRLPDYVVEVETIETFKARLSKVLADLDF